MRDVIRTAGGSQGLRSNFSPDGRWVATTYYTENVVYDFRQHAVVVDPKTGAERRLAPKLHVGDNLQWAPDSQSVYARGLDQGVQRHLPPRARRVREDDRGRRPLLLGLLSLARRAEIATLSDDGYGRVLLRVGDADGSNQRTLVTIDDPTKDFVLGDFRLVSFPSFDGLEISGYEVRPPGFDPKKKYPMLVDVHGGGPGSRLYLMGGIIGSLIERHLWASRGFVVFVPDYRSAAPYGPGVIEKMRGSSFSVTDTKDIMAGVDWMVARGYIDADRIALLGQSAGRIARTCCFRRRSGFASPSRTRDGRTRGSAIRPARTPATGSGRSTCWFFKGTRAENPKAYFDEDPLQRLHEIAETPTLLISGSKDLGGIGGMTNEYMFSMLKRNGTDTKLIYFPDEGHGAIKLANRRFLMQTAIDWVEKHMPEKAP